MCRALKADGVPGGDLLVLNSSASNPLNSQLIVATAIIRAKLGSRLTSVYAPAVIASFGSGAARVDVRAVAQKGPAHYWSAFTADFQQRKQTGSEMSAFTTIEESTLARHQLALGLVDSRLMLDIGSLVGLGYRFDIVKFGDPSPGATAGMPVRSAILAANAAVLQSMLTSITARGWPYDPEQARMTKVNGRSQLVIEFGAPSPMGILSSS